MANANLKGEHIISSVRELRNVIAAIEELETRIESSRRLKGAERKKMINKIGVYRRRIATCPPEIKQTYRNYQQNAGNSPAESAAKPKKTEKPIQKRPR